MSRGCWTLSCVVHAERTLIVSVMHANNETGALNDARAIADLAHAHGALARREVALDRLGALERAGDEREAGHDAVAGVLHLAPPALGDRGAHEVVVLVEQHLRALVAEALRERGRALDVGEHDRD